MAPRIGTLVVVAAVAGAALAACGGSSGSEAPSPAQVAAAVGAAAQELDPEARADTVEDREAAVSRLMGLLNALRELPALSPLFDRYDVAYPVAADDADHGAALVEFLRATRIARVAGVVYVTNRATGEVVYAAPGTDLGRGTLDPSSLPSTDAAPPPAAAVACMSFAYSTWSACRADGTVTRVVLASSPSGCSGGSPVVAHPCTFSPRPLPP